MEVNKFVNNQKSQQAQEELLSLLLTEAGIDVAVEPKINPRKNTFDCYSLSYTQEGLWFLSQLEPESPFYNLAAAVSFKGN